MTCLSVLAPLQKSQNRFGPARAASLFLGIPGCPRTPLVDPLATLAVPESGHPTRKSREHFQQYPVRSAVSQSGRPFIAATFAASCQS